MEVETRVWESEEVRESGVRGRSDRHVTASGDRRAGHSSVNSLTLVHWHGVDET